ncbi:MAG TPA: CBS domain-containing protein [Candidatus Saccharimonadales bacterium]|jgi:CBS domain containing-hemolysin-like protein|nr:CBS domain-containing protein [Candidatus Saccharimonadales bacterium]
MDTVIWLEISACIIWLLLALVRAVTFEMPTITAFELRSRLKSKDAAAQKLAIRIERLPYLRALQTLVVLLLLVLICGITSFALGLIIGCLVTIISFVLVEIFGHWPPLHTLAQKVYRSHESRLIKLTTRLNWLLRLTGRPISEQSPATFYSKQELEALITHNPHALSKDEKSLLIHALNYGNVIIGDIMTPRSKIVAVKAAETLGPVTLDRLHKTGHSRFPVVKTDLDTIVGTLFLHDLVPLNPRLKRVADAMKPQVLYVHKDKTLDHVLQAFVRTRHHIFIVVDESQEVVGLVTIEDILEQIVGRKIVDQFDQYEDRQAVSRLAREKTIADATEVIK